jgi:hypothetical protein
MPSCPILHQSCTMSSTVRYVVEPPKFRTKLSFLFPCQQDTVQYCIRSNHWHTKVLISVPICPMRQNPTCTNEALSTSFSPSPSLPPQQITRGVIRGSVLRSGCSWKTWLDGSELGIPVGAVRAVPFPPATRTKSLVHLKSI